MTPEQPNIADTRLEIHRETMRLIRGGMNQYTARLEAAEIIAQKRRSRLYTVLALDEWMHRHEVEG